jgi:hypothetical protein
LSIAKPSVVLASQGRTYTGPEAAVSYVSVRASVLGYHDAATVSAWAGSRLGAFAVGDPIEVKLGELDSEEPVFTGKVSHKDHGSSALQLVALADTAELSARKLAKSWVNQSVADIVRDLASGSSVDTVQGTTRLSSWAVDTQEDAWRHIRRLAALVGHEVGAAATGGLRFVPVRKGPASKRYGYGGQVVEWQVRRMPRVEPPKAAPHGAGSESGSAKWHHVLRDPGGGEPAVVVGAFHTRDAASELTRALSAAADRGALRGELVVLGDPSVRPGDLVEVTDDPHDAGALRVVSVEQVLSAARGYVTRLSVESAGGLG